MLNIRVNMGVENIAKPGRMLDDPQFAFQILNPIRGLT